MTLYCQVLHDGAVAGEYPVAPLFDGQTDVELLDWKETRHRDGGWTVDRVSPTVMHASKDYPDNAARPREPRRTDRHFRIQR